MRAATLDDLAALTAIRNHYIVNTHITFDTEPYDPADCVPWFEEHCDRGRYRMFVACDEADSIVGYAATGRYRAKQAYETTVEVSIACLPEATGKGIGYQMLRDVTTFESDDLWASVVAVTLASVLIYSLINVLERVALARFGPIPDR